jgi:hypothetical protein
MSDRTSRVTAPRPCTAPITRAMPGKRDNALADFEA